jgi:hypothetical protein
MENHEAAGPVGRGNIDQDKVDKTIWFFRKKHPKEIRPIDLAKYLNCSQARALRIIDLLSGEVEADKQAGTDFLVYSNDDVKPTTYGIYKDVEYGIYR